jgi:hypothetical protein
VRIAIFDLDLELGYPDPDLGYLDPDPDPRARP